MMKDTPVLQNEFEELNSLLKRYSKNSLELKVKQIIILRMLTKEPEGRDNIDSIEEQLKQYLDHKNVLSKDIFDGRYARYLDTLNE